MGADERGLLSPLGLKALLAYVLPAAMIVGGGLAFLRVVLSPPHGAPSFDPFSMVAGGIVVVGGILLFRALRSWRGVGSDGTTLRFRDLSLQTRVFWMIAGVPAVMFVAGFVGALVSPREPRVWTEEMITEGAALFAKETGRSPKFSTCYMRQLSRRLSPREAMEAGAAVKEDRPPAEKTVEAARASLEACEETAPESQPR